jgi:hypothetical protein
MAQTISDAVPRGDSRPFLGLGITFLLLGAGFANPFPLVLEFPHGVWEGALSREALNLYALTAFLGWAHFSYAWKGQWKASSGLGPRSQAGYWVAIAAVLAVFLGLRSLLGIGAFSLAVWVYNIGHFIKAETFFSGQKRSALFYLPTFAFAWFTLALFRVGPLADRTVVFCATIVLATFAFAMGGGRHLAEGELLMPLLTFFLLGETLLWTGYSPYMSPAFRVGLYIVHIAAASFFHYLSSYFFAQRGAKTPVSLRPWVILTVNAGFLALGCAAARLPALAPLRFAISPEWFTLWVALHLAASDLLPWWKRKASNTPIVVSAA